MCVLQETRSCFRWWILPSSESSELKAALLWWLSQMVRNNKKKKSIFPIQMMVFDWWKRIDGQGRGGEFSWICQIWAETFCVWLLSQASGISLFSLQTVLPLVTNHGIKSWNQREITLEFWPLSHKDAVFPTASSLSIYSIKEKVKKTWRFILSTVYGLSDWLCELLAHF